MDRLTKINILGAAVQTCKCEERCPHCAGYYNIVDKLAEYENSKLEPQEVVALKQRVEVLEKALEYSVIEGIVYANCGSNYIYSEDGKEHIKIRKDEFMRQAQAALKPNDERE